MCQLVEFFIPNDGCVTCTPRPNVGLNCYTQITTILVVKSTGFNSSRLRPRMYLILGGSTIPVSVIGKGLEMWWWEWFFDGVCPMKGPFNYYSTKWTFFFEMEPAFQ